MPPPTPSFAKPTTNPQPPGTIRAFAPLRNVDAWYEAFGVKGRRRAVGSMRCRFPSRVHRIACPRRCRHARCILMNTSELLKEELIELERLLRRKNPQKRGFRHDSSRWFSADVDAKSTDFRPTSPVITFVSSSAASA